MIIVHEAGMKVFPSNQGSKLNELPSILAQPFRYNLTTTVPEYLIMAEGIAKVTIDDEVKFLIENLGKLPLKLIEVQTSSYYDEDDII